jgi:hypothetical protein
VLLVRGVAEFVRVAEVDSGFDAGASHPHAEAVWVVVAAGTRAGRLYGGQTAEIRRTTRSMCPFSSRGLSCP